MNIFLAVLLFFAASNSCHAGFSFSNKTSQVKVLQNSNLQIDTPITGWNGTLAIDTGGTVTGGSVQFSDGVLEDSESQSGAVQGSFERNFDTLPTDNVSLSGDQSINIAGDVRGNVLVEGTGNKISGSPRFLNPITLSNAVTTDLAMAIVGDCDSDINLDGGTLTLEKDLRMGLGAQITSAAGTGTIGLGSNRLFIGGVTSGWSDAMDFQSAGTIHLTSKLDLKNVWTFNADITINGDGNILDITDASAQIVLGAGVTLSLTDMELTGFEDGKFVFGVGSKLKISNTVICMTGNYAQTEGDFEILADSRLNMGSTPFEWVQSLNATITTNSCTSLWLETGNVDTPPVFGFIDAALDFTNYVDNEVIKHRVDFEHVRSAIVRYLVGGSVDQDVELDASFFVQPDEAITFTGDSTITADGVNINFSNTSDPQFVVEAGNTANLVGSQTLSIYENTISIEEGATLTVDGETNIVLNSDVSIPSGTIKVKKPGGKMRISGIGGTKRFGLSSAPGIVPAIFDIGFGDLVISNADFFGLSQVRKSRSLVNGVLREGRIVLDGNARIHIQEDTDMNFNVRGSGNALIIEKNNVKLTGQVTFDEFSDNILHIRFELDTEEDQLGVVFGKDVMNLFSTFGIARIMFDDFDVLVDNDDPDSFIVGGHAFIDGQFLRIKTNPIKQGSSDLSLGRDLVFETEGSLFVPIQIVADTTLSMRRGPGFSSSFNFPNLPEREHYFRNRSLLSRAPRRPNLRIPGIVDLRTAKDVIRLQKNGVITNFGSDPFAALELQLSGGARVRPPARRRRRTVKPVRNLILPNFNDGEYTERIKTNDQVFVSGQDNRIIITGNFEVKGKIIFDEKAELIFEFDDSIDTPKALRIATITEAGEKGLEMPKSSSMTFKGAGQVVFENEAKIQFDGEEPTLLFSSAGDQTFDDNRPSLIFKDYAEMAVDLGERIEMNGKGQIILQNNGSIRLSDGQVVVGNDSDDLFDLTADRKSSIKLGTSGGTLVKDPNNAKSRFTLGAGDFAVKFDRQSFLQIRNDGIFEVAVDQGVYLDGHVTDFIFSDQSTLRLEEGGRLGLAQISISDAGSLDSNFFWNNSEGVVEGSGVDSTTGELTGTGLVALFSGASTKPLLEGKVRNRAFEVIGSSALTVSKKLINSVDGLIDAASFVDVDGNGKLLLRNNVLVSLLPGDVVRREDPTLGTVFGTDASGVRFAILTTGERQSLTAAVAT